MTMFQSLRAQLLLCATIILGIVCASGAVTTVVGGREAAAHDELLTLTDAIEGHLLASFYNEEARVLAHSAAALYEFSDKDRALLEHKVKTYASSVRATVTSYANRSREQVERNLERRLPEAIKESLRNHLSVLAAYHAEIDTVLTTPPRDRLAMLDSYARLNGIRSKVGEFRKLISDALQAAKDGAHERMVAADACRAACCWPRW